MRIRRGDTVYIRTGADKGNTGRVLSIDTKTEMLVVEGINMRKRHQRPSQKQPKGGIVSMESPVHISNVAIYSSGLGGPTKMTTRVIDDGGRKKRIRVCAKTGEEI